MQCKCGKLFFIKGDTQKAHLAHSAMDKDRKWLNDTDLLSYPQSRDAIASKNWKNLPDILTIRPWV